MYVESRGVPTRIATKMLKQRGCKCGSIGGLQYNCVKSSTALVVDSRDNGSMTSHSKMSEQKVKTRPPHSSHSSWLVHSRLLVASSCAKL